MKSIYNLKKAFEQIREAMAEWGVYQPQKNWWRIDEIEAGDPSWIEWQEGAPEKGLTPNKSMLGAFNEIRDWYYKTKLFFRARYNVSDQEVNNFFQVYVGYDPMRGVYMMSIGPYFARGDAWASTKKICDDRGVSIRPDALLELANSIPIPDSAAARQVDPNYKLRRKILSVRADMLNKSSYFMRRFGRADAGDIENATQKLLGGVLKNFGVVLAPDDLMLTINELPEKEVGKSLLVSEEESGGNKAFAKKIIPSLDLKSPELQQFMVERPIMGTGSKMELNAQGIDKILQHAAKTGNWADVYETALNAIAAANQITIEEARKTIATDRKFTSQFVFQLKKMQSKMKEEGDARAEFLKIPDFSPKTLPLPRVGQQQNETFRVKTIQKSITMYKLDILQAIKQVGSDDPQKVADFFNLSRKVHKTRAKGIFTAEIMGQWIDKIRAEGQTIKKGKVIKQKSWDTLLAEAQKQIALLEENEELRDVGFPDLVTAYRMASTYFLNAPEEFIDPKTRTKINLVDPPNLFSKEGEEITATDKMLTKLRMQARKKGSEEELKKALQAEIIKEIGDVSKKLQKQPPTEMQPEIQPKKPLDTDFSVIEIPQEKTPIEPEGTPSTTPSPATDAEPVPSEIEEEKISPKKLDLKSLFGNTLKSLIIMAKDLDSQGKGEAAEEIHQIIRKYQDNI